MTQVENWSKKLRLPPILLRYWAWTVAMTLLSLVYTEGMIHLFHSHTTLGPLVLWNDDRWWDFTVFEERFAYFRTPAFWSAPGYPFTYPAAMAVVFEALYKIPHALRIYLLACVAVLLAWAWAVARAIARSGVLFSASLLFALTIPATAWPVWLLLGSANTEGLVAMLLAAGVWAVLRRRWWLGAVLIGVAGAMKIFPLALLALLLSRRRYKEFAFGLAVSAALTLASLAILGPTVVQAQRHISEGFDFVKWTYALNIKPESLDVNHSPFSPIKFVTVLFSASPAVLNSVFTAYCVAAIALGLLLYFLRIRKLPMLNQLLALTICAVLLPPYSVDYTLIHLFVPCGLLCIYAANRWRHGQQPSDLGLCFTCFAMIFTIGTYFTAGYRFGSQVRMAALAVLLIATLRNPWPWYELDAEETT